MPIDVITFESFLKFADGLKELELLVGAKARPTIAEVRARLAEAAVKRQSGDYAAALAAIRVAMDRLSALAIEVDPEEGVLMRLIAERFTQALNFGDKGTARDVVNFMRHRAGDPKDDDNKDW
ncbi:MAG: hypothetical protein ACREQN_19060 [Candidatus Binataceae bacterium]